MELRRHEDLRIGHGRHADEVDEGGAALAYVSALDEVPELALRQSWFSAGEKGCKAGVAERSADAQPVDLFLGLDEAQAHVVRIELDDGELLFQLALLAGEQRAHQPDALGAAALQL